jgi:ADP-heptose:LPS heptosyltransferase
VPSRARARLPIISRALFHRAMSAGRRWKPSDPQRILITHHLLLGDTLMLTPLLAKLRSLYPRAEIVLTAPKAIAPLYERQPYGVIAWPFDPYDIGTIAAMFPKGGFDLAVTAADNRHSWLALALDARWIVAHAGDRPAYKSWPVDELIPYPDRPAAWGDMVAMLIDGPPPPPYDPRDWPAPAHVPFDMPRKPYAVLHVGVSTPLRMWEPHKWQTVAQQLLNRGYDVVWSGGKGEGGVVAEVDPAGAYRSYAGRLDLPQLWQLIQQAALLIVPDTGVAHLGRMTGTPTVALFGPGSDVLFGAGSFWRNSPFRAVIIEDFHCRDQRTVFKREILWVRRCERSPAECAAPACMHAIQVDAVLSAIDALTSKGAPRHGVQAVSVGEYAPQPHGDATATPP